MLGALAPLMIWALSHFLPDPYRDCSAHDVAAFACYQAERTVNRFDLLTLPFWPTRPVVAIIGFVMMEEGRDGSQLVQVSVATIAMLLNAASYALVGLLILGLKDLCKMPYRTRV